MSLQKVIFLSPVGYFKGGAERSLFDLLANKNITPLLVVPEIGPIATAAENLGIPCFVLPFSHINSIHRPFSFLKSLYALKSLVGSALKLKHISKAQGCDIVHSNGLKAHAINCVARCLGGARAVLHIRDIPYTRTEKYVWWLFSFFSDAVILVSSACWPSSKLPKNVKVIHNGTALVAQNSSFKLESEEIVLGFIGRIHPSKGLHILLEWVAAARKVGLPITVSIRGEFSNDAPDYEEVVKEKISTLYLRDCIDFKGFIDKAEHIYQGVDVVIVPSHVPDPLPRSVMEAMARGIPVIGYPAGGIVDMIENEKTGFLVSSSEDFITSIKKVKDNEDFIRSMITNAQKKIRSQFTITGLHENVNTIYQNLH